MSNLRERVLHLLEIRGLTQAEAGRRSGFKNAAFINDIVRGHKTDVGSKGLGALAIGLQTTEDYLLGKTEDPKPKPRLSLISSFDPDNVDAAQSSEGGEGKDARLTSPPDAIFELVARGGLGTGQVITSIQAGEVQGDEVKDDYWRFPAEFARGVLGAMPIHMIVVACTGDSMEPTLSSNERVWVNTLHRKPSPDGLYAIRDIFEGVIIKRLEIVRGDPPRLRIISDNKELHAPQEVGMEEVNIVGKVLCALRLF